MFHAPEVAETDPVVGGTGPLVVTEGNLPGDIQIKGVI
jgi:hypothetical protein